MILYRYRKPGWQTASIGVGTDDGLVDLTSRNGFRTVQSWRELLGLENLVERVAEAMSGGYPPRVDVPWAELADHPDPARPHLLAPVDEQEVWGCGVTYQISRLERMKESEIAGDVYDRVYTAERPEIYYKSPPYRVIHPGGAIRVRRDASWSVPEPELTPVISPRGEIVGYTIGDDVCSRDIEGENPLYLPQAKIYDGSCAIGPGFRLATDDYDPLQQTLSCRIERDGGELWSGSTEIALLKRSLPELVECLYRELTFPAGALLLTGTCLVPPEEITIQPADRVEMELSGLGKLVNQVA